MSIWLSAVVGQSGLGTLASHFLERHFCCPPGFRHAVLVLLLKPRPFRPFFQVEKLPVKRWRMVFQFFSRLFALPKSDRSQSAKLPASPGQTDMICRSSTRSSHRLHLST